MARAAVNQRMRAAGVVPEHPAYAAAVAGGSLRAELESVLPEADVQLIPYHPGLHPRPFFLGIDFYNPVPPLDVHDYPTSHDLAGDGCSGGSGNQAGMTLTRLPEQGDHVLHRLGIGYAKRYLPIGRGIGGVSDSVETVSKDSGHLRENGPKQRNSRLRL